MNNSNMDFTEVTLHRNNVRLSVFTNEDLTKNKNPMGWIVVHDGSLYSKEIFWDNLDYFEDYTKEKKEETKQELIEDGQYYKGVHKDIEYLYKKIKKMGLL